MKAPHSLDQGRPENLGWPPSVTLDQERVLELLTGDRFYSDVSAALREAVLNAIDAVHRVEREQAGGVAPEIRVILNQEDQSLVVSDNGVGMNEDDITRLFAKVGASAATEETSKESVGEFGIGVISYFMAGDSFRVETVRNGGGPIGLEFSRALLAGGTAVEFEASRKTRGTTIRIDLRDRATFDVLWEKFAHWCRDVDGLQGVIEPEGEELRQRGADQGNEVELEGLPSWVERTHLRPVSDPTGWNAMTGNSRIAVLYRGVFVQEFEARGIWGIEGSIDVDPKYFKPRLNRESFVERDFEPQVVEFLEQCHPAILKAMVNPLAEALEEGELAGWNRRRWASLWLAIPRSERYAKATEAWDRVFSRIPAFERGTDREWEPVSLEDIEQMGDQVYVAPMSDDKVNDAVTAAVRLLRNTGRPVVRGLRTENNWMRHASRTYGTTADLIANVFAERVPRLVRVSTVAENLLDAIGKVAPLFTGPPVVDVVRLGGGTVPIFRLGNRLLVNVDHEAGSAILEDTLRENRGTPSLLASVARNAASQLSQAAGALSRSTATPEVLSPIRRRFIKSRLG